MAKTLRRLTAAQTITLADWMAKQDPAILAEKRPAAVASLAETDLGFAVSVCTVEWVAKQRGIPLKRLRAPAPAKVEVSVSLRELARALVDTIRAINSTPDDFLLRLAGETPRGPRVAPAVPAAAAVLPRFTYAPAHTAPPVEPACTAVPVTAETAGGMG